MFGSFEGKSGGSFEDKGKSKGYEKGE